MDNVTKPAHYSGDGIECIDVIEAALGPYGFRMFCLGNVLKYSWRHKRKNGAEDKAKADVYRAWMLSGTPNRHESADMERLLAEGIALADGFPVGTGQATHVAEARELSPAQQALAELGDEEANTASLLANVGEAAKP